MNWLIILSLKAILSSIIGSSFYQWFKNTKVGVWFQVKMDNAMQWVAKRYDIEIATREEKWLSQYPHLTDRIVTLEKEVTKLKKKKQEITMIDVAKAWVKDRLGERTSLDGVALVAVCGSIIMFGGLVKIAAWAGLVYGIYTLVQKG